MTKPLLGILFLSLCSVLLPAQTPYIEFGVVSPDELNMQSCDFYPDAQAVVLGKTGYIQFINAKGWKFLLDVTERIKILGPEGKEEANVKIRRYSPVGSEARQTLEFLKGYSHNLVGGKAQKIALGKKDFFEARINDDWIETSFTFPNVQEGTVIEFQYRIMSDFLLNLSTWEFQDEIPVVFSHLQCVIPVQFNYQVIQLGTKVDMENEVGLTDEYVWYEDKGSMDVKCRKMGMTARKVPPIEEEPYQANFVDLPKRVEFQLMSYTPPMGKTEFFANDYDAFNKKLWEDESFGNRLSDGNFAKNLVPGWEEKSAMEKATELLAALQEHFVWNGENRFFSYSAGQNAFKNKTGSSADINLSLVAGFSALGLNAYPVVLSTRGSGVMHPDYPSFQRINYVVALVRIDGKDYFADATEDLPLGMLPPRCLNGSGWMVGSTGRLVEMKSSAFSTQVVSIHSSLENDSLKNHIQVQEKGLAGYASLSQYRTEGEEAFAKSLTRDLEDWSPSGFEVNEESKNGEIRYELITSKELEDAPLLYLSPIPLGSFGENPFSRPTRPSR